MPIKRPAIGKTENFKDNAINFTDTEGIDWGFNKMLVLPGHSGRADAMNAFMSDKASNSRRNFGEITPIVYTSETAKSQSAIQKLGLTPEAYAHDKKNELLQRTGSFCLWRTMLPEWSLAVVAQAARDYQTLKTNNVYAADYFDKIFDSLVITDEGSYEHPSGEPYNLAERVVLIDKDTKEVELGLVEPEDDDYFIDRLNPIIWNTQRYPDAFRVGTVQIDARATTHDGKLNFMLMGYTVHVDAVEPLLAGVMLDSANPLREPLYKNFYTDEQAGDSQQKVANLNTYRK